MGREDLNSIYCEAGSLPVLQFEELFFVVRGNYVHLTSLKFFD